MLLIQVRSNINLCEGSLHQQGKHQTVEQQLSWILWCEVWPGGYTVAHLCLAAFAQGFKKSGFFCLEKTALSNVPTSQGLPKTWAFLISGKNSLEQRIHKLGASRNMGA